MVKALTTSRQTFGTARDFAVALAILRSTSAPETLVLAGRSGRNSGRGFYDHTVAPGPKGEASQV